MNTVDGTRVTRLVPLPVDVGRRSTRTAAAGVGLSPACLAIGILLCSLLVLGCTAVKSEMIGDDQTPIPDGIPYFLPKRPFVITLTTPAADGPPTITVASGAAEPDLKHEFVLSPSINLLAQNEFNISVASNGLLHSSQSTATSQVTTFVQNAAATAGMLAGPGIGTVAGTPTVKLTNLPVEHQQAQTVIGCPLAGTSYQYIVYPETPSDPPLTFECSDSKTTYTYTVTWVMRSEHPPPPDKHYGTDSKEATGGNKVSGIFFRHELPYLVVVSGHAASRKADSQKADEPDTKYHFIVTSPDQSETDFFHVTRNFFANNTANITITDGVVTGVDQTTQSEVAGLVGLPATFISSYTTAVGQLFSGLTGASSSQQKYLQQMQATAATQTQAAAVAAAQYQACQKTVASFKLTNLSAAEANAAAIAIAAACGSSSAGGTNGTSGSQ